MIYLDTGCLLQLYFPEPESERVAALVAGHIVAFVGIHELELDNALELKIFRKEARPTQVRSTAALVAGDLAAGVLFRAPLPWEDVLRDAASLARTHTRSFGCRSLDILHVAAARQIEATLFVSTDARQRKLALAVGLRCPAV